VKGNEQAQPRPPPRAAGETKEEMAVKDWIFRIRAWILARSIERQERHLSEYCARLHSDAERFRFKGTTKHGSMK
jgi:hypothetical protein